jgi:hypothetical protein
MDFAANGAREKRPALQYTLSLKYLKFKEALSIPRGALGLAFPGGMAGRPQGRGHREYSERFGRSCH